MAKFNIEVELDWLDEENVDQAIKEEVIAGLRSTITRKAEAEINNTMLKSVNEEVEKVIGVYLEKVTSEKIEQIQIPVKENSWGSEVKLVPISEFIGQRFEAMMTEKTLDGSGNKYRKYDSNSGPYSITEYLTRGYIADELNEKVITMIQQARKQAEQTLIKNLEENLQQQLNADMVQKLNIPAMLENLQNTIGMEDKK